MNKNLLQLFFWFSFWFHASYFLTFLFCLLQRCGVDSILTNQQSADCLAFTALVRNRLLPALVNKKTSTIFHANLHECFVVWNLCKSNLLMSLCSTATCFAMTSRSKRWPDLCTVTAWPFLSAFCILIASRARRTRFSRSYMTCQRSRQIYVKRFVYNFQFLSVVYDIHLKMVHVFFSGVHRRL